MQLPTLLPIGKAGVEFRKSWGYVRWQQIQPHFEVQIYGNDVRALTAVERTVLNRIALLEHLLPLKIGECIIKRYEADAWKPITRSWANYKRKHGLRIDVLHATEQLHRDVLRLPMNIKVEKTGTADFQISFRDCFQRAGYVFYHEFGRGNNPKRDFIVKGLEDAQRWVDNFVGGLGFEMKIIVDKPEFAGITKTLQASGSTRTRRFLLPSWIFWVVPAGNFFKVLGMYSDIRGFIAGGFFRAGATAAWLKAYGMGRVGITKKIVRRRVRRGIWRG